jgi:suppressor of tumorigenicity protein 13
MSIITVVDNDTDIVIETKYPKILYFTASWCGPCKMVQPVYEELSVKYPKITFLKIDVDVNQKLAESYEITSMPTFIILKNKEEYIKFYGAQIKKLRDTVEILNSI